MPHFQSPRIRTAKRGKHNFNDDDIESNCTKLLQPGARRVGYARHYWESLMDPQPGLPALSGQAFALSELSWNVLIEQWNDFPGEG